MLYGGMGQGSETGSKTRGWNREQDGSKMGARQVCCLLLPLPPHGGGDLKFYYGGGDTNIQHKMLYRGKTRE